MEPDREVTLWPTAENYERFRAVCDDEVAPTFEAFEALAGPRLIYIQNTHGIVLEKVPFDPDQMAAWCKHHFGIVDAEARKAYAGFLTFQN